jgi:hypothetical protein
VHGKILGYKRKQQAQIYLGSEQMVEASNMEEYGKKR